MLPAVYDYSTLPDQDTILFSEDPRPFMELFIEIPTQYGSKPFILYPWMNEVVAGGITDREIMLKSREIGSSTFWVAYFLRQVVTKPGGNLIIAANNQDNAGNLLDYARHMLHSLPPSFRPRIGKSNESEIELPGLGNAIIALPGTANSARSYRAKYILGTEVAYWTDPDYHAVLMGTGVADVQVAYESTANGEDDAFAQMWHDKFNGWRKHFYGRDANPTHDDAWWQKKRQDVRDERRRAREFPLTAEEAFTLSGDTYFDPLALAEGAEGVKDPISVVPLGREGRTLGEIRTWRPRVEGRHYVLAVDTAEGKEHDDGRPQDYSICHVVEHRGGRHVATIDCRLPDDEFARHVFTLWQKYNEGFVAVERNGPGLAVIRSLQQLGVPTGQFYHYTEQVRELGDQMNTVKHIGWLTTRATKNTLITTLNDALTSGALDSPDAEFWRQMRTLGRDLKARGVAHDDHVIARAIAEVARAAYNPNQPTKPDADDAERAPFQPSYNRMPWSRPVAVARRRAVRTR